MKTVTVDVTAADLAHGVKGVEAAIARVTGTGVYLTGDACWLIGQSDWGPARLHRLPPDVVTRLGFLKGNDCPPFTFTLELED